VFSQILKPLIKFIRRSYSVFCILYSGPSLLQNFRRRYVDCAETPWPVWPETPQIWPWPTSCHLCLLCDYHTSHPGCVLVTKILTSHLQHYMCLAACHFLFRFSTMRVFLRNLKELNGRILASVELNFRYSFFSAEFSHLVLCIATWIHS
jgi:hypothetical protein